jgi:hypothetical protein
MGHAREVNNEKIMIQLFFGLLDRILTDWDILITDQSGRSGAGSHEFFFFFLYYYNRKKNTDLKRVRADLRRLGAGLGRI